MMRRPSPQPCCKDQVGYAEKYDKKLKLLAVSKIQGNHYHALKNVVHSDTKK